MSIPTSRRAMLAGTATLSAASAVNLAAVVATRAAPESAIPDPVYAAIERSRLARAAFRAACDECETAADRAIEAGCRWDKDVWVPVPAHLTEAQLAVIDLLPGDGTTSGLSEAQLETLNKARFAKCYSVEHIEKSVATNPRPERHAAMCEQAKQHLEALQAKHHEAQERVGLTQAEARRDAAAEAESDTTNALIAVVPTTMAGVLARLSYVFEAFDKRDMVFDDADILATLLESTFDVLKRLQ